MTERKKVLFIEILPTYGVLDVGDGKVPGFYKIFDEILVNAADNKHNDPTMDTIRVDIDRDQGRITVWNNGKGIPVVIHKEEKVYVPSLIFGLLLTGGNFDDNEKKGMILMRAEWLIGSDGRSEWAGSEAHQYLQS